MSATHKQVLSAFIELLGEKAFDEFLHEHCFHLSCPSCGWFEHGHPSRWVWSSFMWNGSKRGFSFWQKKRKAWDKILNKLLTENVR